MSRSLPSFLFVGTYYDEFLKDLYTKRPELGELDYESQLQELLDSAFADGGAYSHYLRALGCTARDVIPNADHLQRRWAKEHGMALEGNIHDQRRQIVAAQVEHYRPDVLYIFEWSPLGEAFFADMRKRVRLLVGQLAAPLDPQRTYKPYHLMISSYPPLVDHFQAEGIDSALVKLAFDHRIPTRLVPGPPLYDVSFVGGFAPSHPDRIPWLERLLEEVEVNVFGYGLERTRPNSPIRKHHQGPVWGLGMYEVLQRSRVTLNLHARIDPQGQAQTGFANNLRLYEATGVGTCLLTDDRENLGELFEIDSEVAVFKDADDCIRMIRHLLSHEDQRTAIARAGQARTLRDHTFAVRMGELLEVIRQRL